MCLTGVDYFSTLGYQPGIAFLAAGFLSPVATLLLVLLTLFGALPMYKRVAERSPHGDGSISMLEKLLPYWYGKLFVLALIGFAATGFIITITLSGADAAAHLIENPYFRSSLSGKEVVITLTLIAVLAAVFLKGFKEAVGIAVALVGLYIGLNLVVLVTGLVHVARQPELFSNWKFELFQEHSNPFLMLTAALMVFPKLALGLSGFETGVVVMPLIEGDEKDTKELPLRRIANAKKLLTTAALIMSVLLMASSIVTTLLIPKEAFLPAASDHPAGEASGRALAYLAHHLLGDRFGTVYDFSTILILWFAGASAMAGLLNIVPRYLPRYGMAPEWTNAVRPLVLIFAGICFFVTWRFQAGVEEQAAAYATGVLGLMTSATIAVTLAAHREKKRAAAFGFSLVALIFIYTTGVNIVEQPEGLWIAFLFTVAIIFLSLLSRIWRMLELRVVAVEVDHIAQVLVQEAAAGDHVVRIIPNRPEERNEVEYEREEREAREDHQIPASEEVLFLEVYVTDPSDFSSVMEVTGHRYGPYKVLRAHAPAIPNAVAAFLLWVCVETGKRPHAYFNWTEGNPVVKIFTFLLFGKGESAPLTREILRRVEPDPAKRPVVHSA
jgi:amino acid permease